MVRTKVILLQRLRGREIMPDTLMEDVAGTWHEAPSRAKVRLRHLRRTMDLKQAEKSTLPILSAIDHIRKCTGCLRGLMHSSGHHSKVTIQESIPDQPSSSNRH